MHDLQPNQKPTARGAHRRLSPSRALVLDLLHYHREVPSVSHMKRFDLSELLKARTRCSQSISWSVLFLKAYARLGNEFPRLRQTLINWPWPHTYEHPHMVANIAVNRSLGGEDWLFFAPFESPENKSLLELQRQLDLDRTAPVETRFRTQWRLAHLPLPLRRLLWWLRLNLSGRKRVKRLGTFGLTTLAGKGVTIIDPRAPVTAVLTYGPLNPTGQCDVTIAYDHRITDGLEIAAVLARMESVMQTELLNELKKLGELNPSNAAA